MMPRLPCRLGAVIIICLVTAGVSLLAPGSAALAQSTDDTSGALPEQRRRFTWTYVNAQVHAAVPTTRRGLEILSGPRDHETMKAAIHEMTSAYRALRAAQETSKALRGRAGREKRFTDPVREVQEEHMWSIRRHLLGCLQKRDALLRLNESLVQQCTEHMQQAVRKLNVLVATMN